MEYKSWLAADGTSPVREAIQRLTERDAESAEVLLGKLAYLEKYSFDQLCRSRMIKKVRGKLWEWRLNLKDKTCRIFFVIDQEGVLCLLELIIKKNRKLKSKDIEVAEQRAKTLINKKYESGI